MHTKILIRHETVEALKASPLWTQIMAAAFVGEGPLEVVEISTDDGEPGGGGGGSDPSK